MSRKELFLVLIFFVGFLYVMLRRSGLDYTPLEVANDIAKKYNITDYKKRMILALILLESGARIKGLTFREQLKNLSPRTIENSKNYNFLNYTYFKNTSYGWRNIYNDINFYSYEKFIEALGKVKIGISEKATFIEIIQKSDNIEELAYNIRYYKFTEFPNENSFYIYLQGLKQIFQNYT